jgi:hypothetical protein
VRDVEGGVLKGRGWVNVYRYFSESNIWPRGLPLDRIRQTPAKRSTLAVGTVSCPIQQGLADDNPDVDAIYRLALPLPVKFEKAGDVVLTDRTWCPFNSQNTTWFPEAYPLMYLPFHCSFRMTDIWRSFVAQRIIQERGWGLSFHHATVHQDRNEHNLMHDFADEVVGYLNNSRLMDKLEGLSLSGRAAGVFDDLFKCYEVFMEAGVVKQDERKLLQAWRNDLEAIL